MAGGRNTVTQKQLFNLYLRSPLGKCSVWEEAAEPVKVTRKFESDGKTVRSIQIDLPDNEILYLRSNGSAFANKAGVRGKLTVDFNGNGVQDKGESGDFNFLRDVVEEARGFIQNKKNMVERCRSITTTQRALNLKRWSEDACGSEPVFLPYKVAKGCPETLIGSAGYCFSCINGKLSVFGHVTPEGRESIFYFGDPNNSPNYTFVSKTATGVAKYRSCRNLDEKENPACEAARNVEKQAGLFFSLPSNFPKPIIEK